MNVLDTPVVPIQEEPVVRVPEAMKPRPARHPERWVGALVILVALGFLGKAFFFSPNIKWDEVPHYLTRTTILQGLGLTLILSVVSQALGCSLGAVLAVMRLSPNPVFRTVSWSYIWFFRGTPLLLQIIFWFNMALIFPHIGTMDTNTIINPLVAAILALSLNEASYMAEIVRAGIVSVDAGQLEAGASIGLTRGKTMRKIILPQAMRAIIPPSGNQFIGMLKSTSLVSVIAVRELMTSASNIYATNYLVIELLIVAAIWYLLVTALATMGQFYVERHFSQGDRTRTLTPIQQLTRLARAARPGSERASHYWKDQA